MRRIVLLLAVALLAGLSAAPPGGAAEPRVHVVKAGSAIPDGSDAPFTFTAFYPGVLQVHRGDTVRWDFPPSFAGFHAVTFRDPGGQPPLVWRADETGMVAVDENWMFGHEHGYEERQCGRGLWNRVVPAQPACRLDQQALESEFSSSPFDRIVSVPNPSSFTAVVDLEPGRYPYYCRVHPPRLNEDGEPRGMSGVLEVVEDGQPLENPSVEQVDAQIQQDYDEARELFAQLNDPSNAWDAASEEWVVRAGAETRSGRVEIYQFLPTSLPDVAAGESVRFEAGTSEPNSVAFPADGQGGMNFGGDCDVDSCQGNPPGMPVGVPWGMLGWAFPWGCEYDDPDGGAPMVPFTWTPPRLHERTPGMRYGCREIEGLAKGRIELLVSPYMNPGIAAPGHAVATPGTLHVSGIMLGSSVPDWYALRPDGTRFRETFQARFPAPGRFSYACLNHDFMSGSVTVT